MRYCVRAQAGDSSQRLSSWSSNINAANMSPTHDELVAPTPEPHNVRLGRVVMSQMPDKRRLRAFAGWWYRPEFIIMELNINATITSPAHDESVPLTPEPYTVRGYAYTGSSFSSSPQIKHAPLTKLPCLAS